MYKAVLLLTLSFIIMTFDGLLLCDSKPLLHLIFVLFCNVYHETGRISVSGCKSKY